jgi:hypothetical protein
MSHFTTVRVLMKNLPLLKEVLLDAGHTVKEAVQAQGLHGQSRVADLVVVRSDGHDIGFCGRRNAQGDVVDVDMFGDFWAANIRPDTFLASFVPEYSRRQLLQTATAQGFSVESEERTEAGEVRIVLGRWV